jgi:hypothetical protein
MTLPPPAVCRRILKLHAMIGSSAAHEADTARLKLLALCDNFLSCLLRGKVFCHLA